MAIEAHGGDPSRFDVSLDPLGAHRGVDLEAQALDVTAEGCRPPLVELDGHEPVGELDHVGLEAEQAQGVRRLEAEQATTDHRTSTMSGRSAIAAMASRSSMVRYTKQPSASAPSMGGTNGLDPVARTRWS